MTTETLHARAAGLLIEIVRYHEGHGYPPSVRDLMEAVGIPSTSLVALHLNSLERHGLITRVPELARTLRLTDHGAAMVESLRAAEVWAERGPEATFEERWRATLEAFDDAEPAP